MSEELGSDWVAGDDRVVAFESRRGFGESDDDRVYEFREETIREAGEGVLFVDDRRNAAQFGGGEYRSARISADAENDVWFVFADEAKRLRESDRELEETAHPIDETFALQSGGGDELERKAGLRHDGLFESSFGADEDDAALPITRDEFARDGDGGIDVSSRSAPRDHQRLAHVSPRA